jgi:5'-nucleotidase
MKSDLERDLVVGVSSRALFDLRAEDEIFRTRGLQEYCEYQVAHENETLQPGTGFHLVRLLLRLNELAHAGKRILVIVMSRNNADTSLRIFNSIGAHGLDISRGALTSGEPIAPYIKAFHVDLFLSAQASVDTSKPAIRGRVKPGQRDRAGRDRCTPWKVVCASRDASAALLESVLEGAGDGVKGRLRRAQRACP